MRIEIGSIEAVQEFVASRSSFALVVLFGGARLGCCDEALIARSSDNEILGIVTLSPEGEERSGIPTIVGLYVVPHARKGKLGVNVGTELVLAAVKRCEERGFARIRVDVLSSGAQALIEKLPAEVRSKLDVTLDDVQTLDGFPD